jgi:HlyD family secretion protein
MQNLVKQTFLLRCQNLIILNMAAAKRNKRRKIIVFSLIALVVAGLGIYAWYYRKRERPITVQTEPATHRTITELVSANGRIQPVVYVKISPEVSGEIIDLPVKEGQEVRKGDLLLKIKPDFYVATRNSMEASLNSTLASISQARANMAKAEAELKRYEELFASKLVSDSQYLEVKTTYDSAKAGFQHSEHQASMARASLARAEEELSKTTIYSPLSGTISKLNSQLGERVVGTATYQGTEVMTIANLDDMEARVDIGEIDVVLIKPGQKTRLEVDSFRDRKFIGIVSNVANTAKTQGAGSQQEATKFEVRIRIVEREEFRPGMSVTAEVETRTRTNVLTAPIQSVTTRAPKKTNAVTNVVAQAKSPTNTAVASSTNSLTETNAVKTGSGKKPGEANKPIEVVFAVENDVVRMIPVKRGISDDAYVEITEGLCENTQVVSGGYKAINRELEDGKKVKVDNSTPSTDKDDKNAEPRR